jgi:hypothetical protein
MRRSGETSDVFGLSRLGWHGTTKEGEGSSPQRFSKRRSFMRQQRILVFQVVRCRFSIPSVRVEEQSLRPERLILIGNCPLTD